MAWQGALGSCTRHRCALPGQQKAEQALALMQNAEQALALMLELNWRMLRGAAAHTEHQHLPKGAFPRAQPRPGSWCLPWSFQEL